MSSVPESTRLTPDRRPISGAALIRALMVVIWVVLLWPLPAIIGFSNPAEADILGRYTTRYFVVMLAYGLAFVAWMALTGWALLRLNDARLADLRRRLERRWLLAVAVLLIALLALAGVRVLRLAGIIGFPPQFLRVMVLLPGLLIVGFAALAALIADAEIAHRLNDELARPLARLNARWIAPLAFALLVIYFLISLLFFDDLVNGAFWKYPLGVDGGMHVYVGQLALAGGKPYQSFAINYLPGRFAISILWSLGAKLTTIPVITFARGLNIVAGVGVLAAAYGMGRQLTGSKVGGLIAAVMMLGTEHLYDVLIGGPIFKPVTTLLMMLSLWMAQRGKWLPAGFLVGAATLVYSPVAIVALMLVAAALLQDDDPRIRAALLTIAGGALVLLVTALALLLAGVLDEAFRYSILSALDPQIRRISAILAGEGSSGGGGGRTFGERLDWYRVIFGWTFRGDWEMVALMLLGPLLLIAAKGVRKALLSRQTAVLLLPGLVLLISVILDEGGASDMFIRVALLAPFAAAAVISAIDLMIRRLDPAPANLRGALACVGLVLVFLFGAGDVIEHQRFLYDIAYLSLNRQQRMADSLQAALGPDDSVFVLTDMWYLTLTGTENAVPIRRFGAKSDVIQAAGWTPATVARALDADRPVVVMWFGPQPRPFPRWLEQNYRYVGRLETVENLAQDIYVLRGADSIQQVIADWPLNQE